MTVMTTGQGSKGGRGKGGVRVDPNGTIPADRLSREQLAQEYGFALNVIWSVGELRDLFIRALSDKKGQWTPERFQAAVQNTQWYRSNDYYARTAWAQEQVGGADWTDQVNMAKQAVQRRAAQLGAKLTGPELDALSRRFLYEGWGQGGRAALMDEALSGEISFLPDTRGQTGFIGQAGTFIDELRQIANANGIRFSDSWYEAEARSVASGLSTEEDSLRKVREQAASRWGSWGEQIRNGQNMYEIASPYINLMADTLELSPDAITLEDPYISRALTGQDGNPMPLWEFQRQLRNDPRWMNTNFAQNEVTGVADAVMQMFGLRG